MRQIFLAQARPDTTISIEDGNFHHLVQVLRAERGSSLRVLFGNGEIYLGVVSEITGKSCTITLTEKVDSEAEDKEIILLTGIPKGKKMDQIVRQATECGVSAIYPLKTEFSQVKIDQSALPAKCTRWERIIKEAMEQSGSSRITKIHPPIEFSDLPAVEEDAIGLFFHEKRLETNSLHRYLSIHKKKLYLCFGAEGGFSESETKRFAAAGYRPVFMGNRILRSETAVVYALGAVQTLLQETREWILQN